MYLTRMSPKMSVSFLPSLKVIITKCILRIKQLKICLMQVKILNRSTFPSLPQLLTSSSAACDMFSNTCQPYVFWVFFFRTYMFCECMCVCLVVSDYCDPMDSSPPASSVHGIPQVRILEWVVISFSRGSSCPRDQTCIAGGFFTNWATINMFVCFYKCQILFSLEG